MKTLLRIVAALLLILAAGCAVVWLNFDWVRYNGIVFLRTPSKLIDALPEPMAFDYANEDAWAALPMREDGAGQGVEGEIDLRATAPVDVFFVHFTTYARLYKDGWNQSADDAETNAFTDWAMRGRSPFNGCCRVYAPRYRQTTLGAFADETGSGAKALALATADVERAFDYFIEHYNAGRPFILAGASQGGAKVFDLLKSRISGTELRKRMVAAYPLVFWKRIDEFAREAPDIPVCSTPTETGCVATFNPVGPNVRTGLSPVFDRTGIICVNPLTWKTDGAYAGFHLNIGARRFATPTKLIPGVADAQCDINGRLIVTEIRADMYEGVPPMVKVAMELFGRENYHSIALGLYYGNIRRNAQERVDAFLATQSEAAGGP
jgi:hypothetical protein